ncbi:hypothetical protein CVT25_001898 [Psilocybe cyanescens]|uniref:F-box domain-containing protein n=1 Tax=Psilocybe cyanescens TaxID=93625 RepID=A0A409WQX8_PSICY|nr:hypothetical protein CVT25_001898 [Psilocybe cyanescens]
MNLERFEKNTMNGSLFPPELVRIIVENLSYNRPELHALTLVSKTFHWEAMRLLYRSMTDPEGTRHYNFLVAVRKRPELAELIHTYHVPTIAHSQKRPLWSLILRSLLLMVNLKELAYLRLFAIPLTPFPGVRKGQKMPFQLETFIWTIGWRGPWDMCPFHPTKTLQFLETQHELRYLRWSYGLPEMSIAYSLPEMSIAPNIVPKLKILYSSFNAIQAFLPCRTITDLFWEGPTSPATSYLILKLKEFSGLRAVSLPGDVWSTLTDPRVEGKISPLNTIKVLELRSAIKIHKILPIIAMFPCLKRLIITPDDPHSGNITERYPEADIFSLYEQSSNLIYVDVRISDIFFKRWINKLLSPDMVIIPYDRVLELE